MVGAWAGSSGGADQLSDSSRACEARAKKSRPAPRSKAGDLVK